MTGIIAYAMTALPRIPVIRDPRHDPEADRVLTTAFVRAAAMLHVNQATQAKIIGVSPSTISRLDRNTLKANSKTGELALLFLRVARSVLAYLGNNAEPARQWLHGVHRDLGGRPIELMQTTEGLVNVADYMDAVRGQ